MIAGGEAIALAAVILVAVGLAGSVAAFVMTRASGGLGRAHERIDGTHHRIDRVKDAYVSQRELNGSLLRIDEKITGLHGHFDEKIDGLNEQHAELQRGVDRVHGRLDEFLKAAAGLSE